MLKIHNAHSFLWLLIPCPSWFSLFLSPSLSIYFSLSPSFHPYLTGLHYLDMYVCPSVYLSLSLFHLLISIGIPVCVSVTPQVGVAQYLSGLRDLGATFHQELNISQRVNMVTPSCYYQLGRMRFGIRFLSHEARHYFLTMMTSCPC